MNMCSLLGICAIALVPSIASSSDFESYRRAVNVLAENEPRPSIGSVASGFGASQGQFFAAVSYSDRDLQTDNQNDDDGSIVIGLGIGNPQNIGALELSLGITSVSTSLWGDGKFADEGNLNAKLHKIVPTLLGGDYASVSIGASNLTGWGSTRDMPTNSYLAYSEHQSIGEFSQYKLAYSFGYGSSAGLGESGGSLFGGIALARSNFTASLSMNKDEVNLTAGMYFATLPELMVTVTRADIFNDTGYERNILTIGYSRAIGFLK